MKLLDVERAKLRRLDGQEMGMIQVSLLHHKASPSQLKEMKMKQVEQGLRTAD